MKIIVNKDKLLPKLVLVASATARRDTLPVLTAVHISAQDSALSLLASDMETSLCARNVEVQVLSPGAFCVNAAKFLGIVKSIAGGDIEIERNDNHSITIKNGRSKFKVPGHDPEEYPVPKVVIGDAVSIDSHALVNALSAVLPCVSTDSTRANLCGVRFHEGCLIATDGHRLGIVDNVPYAGKGFTLPFDAAKLLVKLASHGGEVSIALGENESTVQAVVGNTALTSRLPEGDFPDFTQVIPKQWTSSCVMVKDEFLGALNRVSNASTKHSGGVKFKVEGGEVSVACQDGDGFEATDAFLIEDGEPATIEFGGNGRYFIEAANACPNGSVTLSWVDNIRPLGISQGNIRFVIMPMRL